MNKKSAESQLLRLLEKSKPFLHWGAWIKARSLRVGYRRQMDLAEAVGCERTQLYKWFSMERPPLRMKKEFDKKLAAALKIDRETLFNGWRLLDAGAVPFADPDAGDEAFAERQRLLDALSRMLSILRNDGLKRLVGQARLEIDKIAGAVDERMRREKPPTRRPRSQRHKNITLSANAS